MIQKSGLKIGMGCLLVLALSGCSGDHLQSLKNFVNDEPHTHGHIPALPKTPVYHPTAFKGAKGQDPFISFSDILLREEAEKAGTGPHPVMTGPLKPLQKFSVSELSLVGMMRWDNQLWGIIKTPKGKVYRVTKSSLLGNMHGKVVALDDHLPQQSVTVLQYLPNAFGGYKKQSVVIHMATD